MKAILLILTAASLLFGAYTRDAVNNTVYDDATDLSWQDDGNISINPKSWSDAIDYCEALNFAGVQDWRLPNKNELLSITDLTRINPAIDPTFQNVTSNHYWSSTTYAGGTSLAWVVLFNDGYDGIGNKSNSFYVRCVRGGQIAPLAPPAVAVPLSNTAKATLALLFGLGVFFFMRRRHVA